MIKNEEVVALTALRSSDLKGESRRNKNESFLRLNVSGAWLK